MANELVVRKGTNLARRLRTQRAAQYVRMSRELQRYSIENQRAAIAAYAAANGLTVVRTYEDQGRSGLRIKGRPGLIELIEDVQSGEADFDQILVYDVSRWGRFQDTDESAYYEFLCKMNGVRVVYCAEIFKNDGSLPIRSLSAWISGWPRSITPRPCRAVIARLWQRSSARHGRWPISWPPNRWRCGPRARR
ncbi:recombinase family protein [Bradyrhizobium barranii]|uniref:recombinase family protein n=1 Tax=Bradyrhizobium barranii TaxID=2992140 RepID=UPI001407AF07|nr:recombinase family protein [Bradyrhizobium barranii]